MVEKWNTNKEGSAPRKILPLEKLENREEKWNLVPKAEALEKAILQFLPPTVNH